MSMAFSSEALHSYLYGIDIESGISIERHTDENRSIKSNFLAQNKIIMFLPFYSLLKQPYLSLTGWEFLQV